MTDHNFPQPPAWYVDACEGARDAHDAWQAAKAELAPLLAAERAVIQDGLAVIRWDGTPGDARRVPAPGRSTSELEYAVRATAKSGAALAAGHRRVRAAYDRFTKLVHGNGHDRDNVRKLAAEIALAKHAEAAAAWQVVQSALAARDEAYRFAGAPGESWEVAGYRDRPQANDFAGQAVTHVSKRVDGFPVRDVSDLLKEV